MHMKCALTSTSSASLSLTLPVALSRPHSTTHTPCLLLSLSFSRTHRAAASHSRIVHKIKLADFSAVFHQVCLRFPAFSFFPFIFISFSITHLIFSCERAGPWQAYCGILRKDPLHVYFRRFLCCFIFLLYSFLIMIFRIGNFLIKGKKIPA